MARIRTIKPEFPQSESMGRVSRDSRLLFISLWTLCDDSGRTRGNSRMLASLLFPYDDDVPALIDDWLGELESEGCIVRYLVDGATYIEICNWLNHQKIDKPSQSKIPAFTESSRILANPREHSLLDQGSKDQGSKDQGSLTAPPASPASTGGVIESAPDDKKETALQAACRETWASYALAYSGRYGVEPVRNVQVSSKVKQFVQRIGHLESPLVAAYFVSHADAFYVKKCHDFGLALKDCEKLRTEWATQRQITGTQARQAEQTASNFDNSRQALAMLQAEGFH